MGSKVEVDDRGRVTIPKDVRDRLHIRPGDELEVKEEKGILNLYRRVKVTHKVKSGRKWGSEAFLDAGEATFGNG